MARRLARLGITPNQISVASVLFAALAAGALLFASARPAWRIVLLVAAAAFIQLRLVCNLMDGMVAIEEGHITPTGDLYNDVPDRISDPLVLIAAGYSSQLSSWLSSMGWASAVLAVMTAYVRMLGGALGLDQDFRGPMAKPHRMAVLTVACLGEAVIAGTSWSGRVMLAALVIIVGGCIVTLVRRVRTMAARLRAR
jgi:phosphatidylglycerophosphate synthase